MNLPTILILALIGIALFAALRSMKKHPSGCSGHCSTVPCSAKVKNIDKTAACPLQADRLLFIVSEKKRAGILPTL